MKKYLLILAEWAFVFVVGCLAVPNQQQIADSWIGHNVNDLIANWGPPTQVIDNGSEGKIMAWSRGGAVTMPGTAHTTYGYTGAQTTYFPGQTLQFSSSMTFWVNPQNIIYRASYVGY